MTQLTWRRIVLIVAITGAAGWIASRFALSRGSTPLRVPWSVTVVCLILAAVALAFAWSVRQYKQGKRPGLSGIRAARTVALAQASAYAGAVIAGVYGGYALALADMWGHGPRRETAISALIAVAGGLLLLAAGVVSEHWCKTDRRDDDPTDGGSTAAAN